MQTIIKLYTSRDAYDVRDAAEYSMTIGELISELRQYDEDDKVVFCNDNGYTYGGISESEIVECEVETYEEERKERKERKEKEEERERERREKEEEEREEYESTMQEVQEELTDLQSRYENDNDMTDEDYREEKADIFYTYGVSEDDYKIWASKR